MDIRKHLLKKGVSLTPSQTQGLSLSEKPALLLAVPGSGKTTVLVARTAALLETGLPPDRMLNLTFSRNSAEDMRKRFELLFNGLFAQPPHFSTIHSFCLRLLRDFGKREDRLVPAIAGTAGHPSTSSLIRQALRRATGSSPDEETLAEFSKWIGFAKNQLLPPSSRPSGAPESFPRVLALYEEAKRAAGLMDYDDMPLFAARILRSRPTFRSLWQERFDRINVDEAQDLSPSQHAVLRLLSPLGTGLFLVGDEDQSIYGFRGASPQELLRFAESFPGAQVWKMEENFRSRPEILACCSSLIRSCPERYDKELRPTRERGGRIEQVSPSSMEDAFCEIASIISEIPAGQTVGILYRNNLTAGPLALFLAGQGIPFRMEPSSASICRGPVRMQEAFLRLCSNPGDLDAFHRLRFQPELDSGLFQEVLQRADGRRTVPQLLRECAARSENGGSARKLADLLDACCKKAPAPVLEHFEKRTALGKRLLTRIQQGDAALRLRECQFRYFCRQATDYAGLRELLRRAESPLPFRPDAARLTLSTIHAAKGLEYDVILLLDAFDGILPDRTALEELAAGSPASYHEEIRLFYVAATRSRERLILFSPPKNGTGLRDSRFFSDFFRTRLPPRRPIPEIPPGTAVRHRVFGAGIVAHADGDSLTVSFSAGNMKTISLSYCISKGLLRIKRDIFR
ncbi:MAG: ATP-dependent helicase [Candidatus Merdivicinus sp.]|jgi:DNA helicase-2/ATP-dependent DNA helicase PcrA